MGFSRESGSRPDRNSTCEGLEFEKSQALPGIGSSVAAPLWGGVWRKMKLERAVEEFPSWFSRNESMIHEDSGSIPGLAQWVKDLTLP